MKIGRATIHNIDCMQFMKTCDDNQFDLAICDPPYFDGPNKLGYYGRSISSTGVKRIGYPKTGTWNVPDQDYFDELKRISKNQIIWGINYYPIKNIGCGRIVWDKCNGNTTFSDVELAYCSIHDSVRLFAYVWNGMQQGQSIFNGRKTQGNKKLNEVRIHPTQKPVALYEWLLSRYAKQGDLILDTHMGSGSIAIATNKLGFELSACELDPEHFELCCKRLNQNSLQIDAFLPTIEPPKHGVLM